MRNARSSKSYWNRAARDNAAWYIATGFTRETPQFFELGAREVDEFLDAFGVAVQAHDTVVEIGSGVGRMTGRLATLAGTVIATDVSGEMLSKAQDNLAQHTNVRYLEVPGDGTLPLESGSADAVFSYITMQHVPTVTAQEKYFSEALRVLRPGGWALIQYRRSGVVPRLLDWAGHLSHLLTGRRTLHRAWRGSRVPEARLTAYETSTTSVQVVRRGRRHLWVLARHAA